MSTFQRTCHELRAALCDLAMGANMMLQVPGESRDLFVRYAQEVKRVAEEALAASLDVETADKPRWKCPRCGSTHVQIALPAWYRETLGAAGNPIPDLRYVNTDYGASILSWVCDSCGNSDMGCPQVND